MTVLRLDGAPKASWDGIPFAVDSIEILGEGRYVVHEYPHQDGGDVEKMGRKLYVIRLEAIFDEGFKAYPGNYPGTIDEIVRRAEMSSSHRLVLPNAGSIVTLCTKWPRKWVAAVRSGERMALEFLEDETINDLDTFASNAGSYSTLESTYADVNRFRPLAPMVPDADWLALENGVASLLTMRDQADRRVATIEAKVLSVTQMISRIDRAITTPIAYPVIRALVGLAGAAAKLTINASPVALALRFWTVPKVMDITTVSRILYGRTDKALDILQMNAIADAGEIPAGTSIRWLPLPSQVAA